MSKVCSVSKDEIKFAEILNSKHMISMMTIAITTENSDAGQPDTAADETDNEGKLLRYLKVSTERK
jgi:hypothetical protein